MCIVFSRPHLLLLAKRSNFGGKNSISVNTPTPSRWQKFASDVGIYTVGNIGAKLITFALVPFYTHFIPDTAQFGYFDICLTAAFLLSPLLTLNVYNGIVRYLLDADLQARQRVTTAMVQLLLRWMTACLAVLVALSFAFTIAHRWLALALVVSVTLSDCYGQLARGLGRNKVFVGMGIATAFLVATLSVVLVAWMRMGIAGVFLANILARFLPVVAVEWRHRLLARHYTRHTGWHEQARELLRYSVPLLPTIVIWWVLAFGDRWFVLWAAGPEANGVYAVAARFTGIIYTFAVILQQAWQETAILQYDSDGRDKFFSQIFSIYVFVLITIIVAYTAALHLAYGWLVDNNYAASAHYIFPMAVAAGIYSIANFFEMGYQCSKQTHRAVAPSIVTGIVNVCANLVLAPLWGCYGVIAASLLSFTVFALYRAIDTRRYFVVQPDARLIVPVAVLAVFGAMQYVHLSTWLYALTGAMALAIIAAALPWSRLWSHVPHH